MTSVLLSTDNARSLKALQLAVGAADWLELPDRRVGIPSQRYPGAFYTVDANSCSCPDAKYNRTAEPCKHVTAVRLREVFEAAAALDEPRTLKAVA